MRGVGEHVEGFEEEWAIATRIGESGQIVRQCLWIAGKIRNTTWGTGIEKGKYLSAQAGARRVQDNNIFFPQIERRPLNRGNIRLHDTHIAESVLTDELVCRLDINRVYLNSKHFRCPVG